MRAIRARAPSACAYDIEIVWGDAVLLREHVFPAVPFVLSSRARSEPHVRTFVVGEELVCATRRELVSVHDGVALFSSSGAPLGAGASEELQLGALRVRVTGSDPERVASLRRPAPRLRSHAWTLASLAVHLLALACMALLPPRASSLSLELASDDARTLRYLATALEREPLPAAFGTHDRSGGEGVATPDTTREPVSAPARGRRRQPHAATPLRADRAGILGVLAASVSQLPAGPFSDGVDYDPVAALAALGSALPGEHETIGGLGLRGPGRSGAPGPLDSIAVGALDTGKLAQFARAATVAAPEHRARVPRASMEGDATVRGSLSREVIRRTIQRHLSEVRFCYESALRSRPELAGRVSVGFLIAPSGAVQATNLADSSLSHAGVEQCIVQAVRRWTFPAPEGGGYVQVNYPFLLEQR